MAILTMKMTMQNDHKEGLVYPEFIKFGVAEDDEKELNDVIGFRVFNDTFTVAQVI
jgi:hypothetical protein